MHKVSDVKMGQDILRINRHIASENRELFDRHGITVFNVMGAIGSGKTCLIEHAIEMLKGEYRIACIAGDVVASYDSERMARHGVPVIPVSTGKECHLDAHFVEHALEDVDLASFDVLFIENVGNLICPADFDLGEHAKVVVVSVSEGDDIVLKHPVIFKTADLTVVNKVDIAPYVGASAEKMHKDAVSCGSSSVILTSCRKGEGLASWVSFLRSVIKGT
ncbi:MAG: hydrogenase nickel incorporation protein HypB [Candidatus Methanofastidiosa archaeon]|nr:hydrogenase nickel incorporation protein HypB [Candidatus Methanofastidiosa archaeon]